MSKRRKYGDEPLDLSSRRSIEIISPPDTSPLISDQQETVALKYFYHAGEFWNAVVPLDGVANILGQAFNFSKPKSRKGPNGPEILYDKLGTPRRKLPILNHVQSRFVLHPSSPVELYPLDSDMSSEPTHSIGDFVYTLEAVGPVGVSFNLKDALNGSLVSTHRFLSTQEMVFERVAVENQYVLESPPLPLDDSQRRRLLVKSIERSHCAGLRETYYLYRCCATNNCTSSPLQILDGVVPYSFSNRLGSFLYRLPLNPRFYLRVRGLDADPTHRKLIRTEFEEFVNAPATQKRKREFVRKRLAAVRAARKRRNDQSGTES